MTYSIYAIIKHLKQLDWLCLIVTAGLCVWAVLAHMRD